MTHVLKQPLSNLQLELLKIYSVGISDNELSEVKTMLSKHFLNKTRDEADKIWQEKKYGEKQLKEWLGQ